MNRQISMKEIKKQTVGGRITVAPSSRPAIIVEAQGYFQGMRDKIPRMVKMDRIVSWLQGFQGFKAWLFDPLYQK